MTKHTPAAQYLRMSTEHQQYSIENQSAAIAKYAQEHGFEIVQSYVDAGKTGVVLRNRAGLQRLLGDVISGNFNYRAILVYDISRWGRFQDIDEAAHYEFLCRHAGIGLHYCAEQFSNDSTLPSSILKALKRTMAAEYSRELSAKVYEGKRAAAKRGLWVGGQAGLALERLMLAADGTPKQRLLPGEQKNLSTDRVVLIPGSAKEIKLVRTIFELALHHGVATIARMLNAQGFKSPGGSKWNADAVYRLVRNPKYAGCNTWGKSERKLYGPLKRLKREKWITCPGAFPAIISQKKFEQVQHAITCRRTGRTDAELIAVGKRLLAKHGKLTLRMFGSPGVSAQNTFRHHFGNFIQFYKAVGYKPEANVVTRAEAAVNKGRLRRSIDETIVSLYPNRVQIVHKRSRRVLIVDGQIKVTTVVCGRDKAPGSRPSWHLVPTPTAEGCAVLLCLADANYTAVESMHVLADLDKTKSYRIKYGDPWLSRGLRISTLEEFCNSVTIIARQNGT